jgi:glycosyltransferase involved in cell wall biosynthesis
VTPPLRVVWAGPPGRLVEALRRAGTEVVLVEESLPGGGRTSRVWARRAAVRQARPATVHLEGTPAVEGWGLAARLAGAPVVWHLADPPHAGTLRGVRPAALLADSRTALRRLPPAPRSRVLPVVVDEPAEVSFPSFGPVRTLGVVCPVQASGGNHVFLRAFRSAFGPPSRTRAIVRLSGDDPLGQEERRLWSTACALGIGSRLQFTTAPLDPYLPRLDAFVHLPLDPPTDPLEVLTAMASGVPVLAARAGADAEVVEPGVTGLLVDADDAADLTLQLMRLDLDLPLRSRLAAAGLHRAQDFTPEHAAQALLAVYQEVL